jgi:hypothetical protein
VAGEWNSREQLPHPKEDRNPGGFGYGAPESGNAQGRKSPDSGKVYFIHRRCLGVFMGFKKTSELIAVSFGTNQLAPNAFIEEEVALQLDVLNNEVAVVLAIDIDVEAPDAIAGINTSTTASVSATTLAAVGNLSQSNVLSQARDQIQAAGFVDGGVAFSRKADSTYTGDLDYLGIIATNNFFVQLGSVANIAAKGVVGRVWLYRAKADSSTYAALVQSEVLSA